MAVKDSVNKAGRATPRSGPVPVQSYRPPPPAPPSAGAAVGGLWRWWPIRLILAAALALAGWLGWRTVDYQRHAVPGGIAIDTAGAKGGIANAVLTVNLPVAIYNGAQSPVIRVTLWVNVWACPAAWSPQGNCRKVLSTLQDLPMQVARGGQAHMSNAYRVGVAGDLDGAYVRIERQVEAVKTEGDIPPPGMPSPNLNSQD